MAMNTALSTFVNLTKDINVKNRAEEVLGKEASVFIASVLDMYKATPALQKCNALDVMNECFKAASLKLPINKNLGFAYVVPYGNVPQFQIGYKGMIQLAQRSGMYKNINADCVYKGEVVKQDRITGNVEITGEPDEDATVVGYFAHFELLNGFQRTEYWTKAKVERHASHYSKMYHNPNGAWQTNFDAMAIKTVLKSVLKYGIMSIEMAQSFSEDRSIEEAVDEEVAANANVETITIDDDGTTATVEPAPATKKAEPPKVATSDGKEDPGF